MPAYLTSSTASLHVCSLPHPPLRRLLCLAAGVVALSSHGWGPTLRSLHLHECQLGPQAVVRVPPLMPLKPVQPCSLLQPLMPLVLPGSASPEEPLRRPRPATACRPPSAAALPCASSRTSACQGTLSSRWTRAPSQAWPSTHTTCSAWSCSTAGVHAVHAVPPRAPQHVAAGVQV
jgi:hypothetical protein